MERFLGKKICILGLGLENHSLLKFLGKVGFEGDITVCDSRNIQELEARLSDVEMDVKLNLGKKYDADLAGFDVILRSPGYPLFTEEIKKAKKKGALITSAMAIFLKISPTANIIGVTGSKGKGTTSSLIYTVLKKAGKKVYLGGNIGTPPFDFFSKLKKDDWVVLELSSFQLEDLEARFKIAVITNLFKEHLSPVDPNNHNYHKTMKSYWEAKTNIFKYQKKGDFLVASARLKDKLEQTVIGGRVVFYTESELSSKLTGGHNKENIAAALEAAKILKIKKDVIVKAVAGFKGLPHRLEKVATIAGVEYYDDSFATIPEGSILALKSFAKPIILLAGGADKGADFKDFAREIKKRVKYLILFKGKGSEKILKSLQAVNCKLPVVEVSSMPEAMKIARAEAEKGDIILLSTGCASFGVFKNYKERGDLFKKFAKELN